MRKNINVFALSVDEAFEKNLKYFSKSKLASQLFDEGLIWFNSGKKIEDANDKIVFGGKEMQKKEQINFQRGFQEGEKRLGFGYGYRNTNLLEIPQEYQGNRFFLAGYREGLIACQKEEKKSTNSRHK